MAKCNTDIRGTLLAGFQALCSQEVEVGSERTTALTEQQRAWEEILLPGLGGGNRGPPKIQMSSYFCKPVCGKFVERTNGLELSQERGLKTVTFLHYLSIRKPEIWFCDIQQIGAEAKDV